MTTKPFVPTWPRFMDGVIGWFFGGFALLMIASQLIGWLRGGYSTDSVSSFFSGAVAVCVLMEAGARVTSYRHANRLGIAETPVVVRWTIVRDHAITTGSTPAEANS